MCPFRKFSTQHHMYYHDFCRSPLFVSWERLSLETSPKLRGCIGSLAPRHLHEALVEYALHSSLRDARFEPIQYSEIPHLMCKVSLLHSREPARHCLDWKIGEHGVILNFKDRLDPDEMWSATYLPDVAEQQGWSKQQTVDSLIRKTGYAGCITDHLRTSLTVTRYQSSVTKVAFQEYASY